MKKNKKQEIKFKTGAEVWFKGMLVKVISINFSGNRFVGYTVGNPRYPMHGKHAEQFELRAKDEPLTLDSFEGLINEMEFGKKTKVYLVQNPVFRDLRIESAEKDLGRAGVAITAAENAIRKAIKGAGYIRQIAKYRNAREFAIFLKDGDGERTEKNGKAILDQKDGNRCLYVATVIDHGDTCDGHVRNLAQGTKEECERAIAEDKEDFARGLMSSTLEDDAITKDDFCVKANEIWYAPNGKNDFTDGRIYDLLVVMVPNGKEGK